MQEFARRNYGEHNQMVPSEVETHLQEMLARHLRSYSDRKQLAEEAMELFNLTCDEFFSDQIRRIIERDITAAEAAKLDRLYKAVCTVGTIIR